MGSLLQDMLCMDLIYTSLLAPISGKEQHADGLLYHLLIVFIFSHLCFQRLHTRCHLRLRLAHLIHTTCALVLNWFTFLLSITHLAIWWCLSACNYSWSSCAETTEISWVYILTDHEKSMTSDLRILSCNSQCHAVE